MALTQTLVGLLVRMRKAGLFDLGTARVLDLGEQNLYGDVRPADLPAIARALKLGDDRVAETEAEVARLTTAAAPTIAFDLAKLVYRLVFDNTTCRAIDSSDCANEPPTTGAVRRAHTDPRSSSAAWFTILRATSRCSPGFSSGCSP